MHVNWTRAVETEINIEGVQRSEEKTLIGVDLKG